MSLTKIPDGDAGYMIGVEDGLAPFAGRYITIIDINGNRQPDIDTVITMFPPTAEAVGVELIRRGAPADAAMLVDGDRIYQVATRDFLTIAVERGTGPMVRLVFRYPDNGGNSQINPPKLLIREARALGLALLRASEEAPE